MEEGVLDLLREAGWGPMNGVVTSVYKNTVNLELDNGAFLVVASSDTMMAPQMIRIEKRVDFQSPSLGIKPCKPICIIGEKIWFNETVSCSVSQAEILSLRIPELEFNNPDQLRYEVNRLLLQFGKPGGFRNPWQHFQAGTSKPLTLQEMALYTALCRLISESQAAGAEHFLEKMTEVVGLGVGLTPSGDDFLTGFFAVMAAADPHFRYWRRTRKDHWLRLVAGRTTGVSCEMLKHVLNSRVNQAVLDLLRLFAAWKTPTELVRPIHTLLELGSSSGTDMLTGMVFGLDYLQVWKGRKHND